MNNICRYTKVQIIISEEKTISVFKISISYVAHDLTHVYAILLTYMYSSYYNECQMINITLRLNTSSLRIRIKSSWVGFEKQKPPLPPK